RTGMPPAHHPLSLPDALPISPARSPPTWATPPTPCPFLPPALTPSPTPTPPATRRAETAATHPAIPPTPVMPHPHAPPPPRTTEDRKSTRLHSSHVKTSYAVF